MNTVIQRLSEAARLPGHPVRWPARGAVHAVLACCTLLAVACSANADNAIEASLEEPFRLKIRQTAKIAAENIEVGLMSVTADSRCPKNETCVWEGDAVVRISLRVDGGITEQFELHTNAGMASTAALKGYSVELVSLHPFVLGSAKIEPEKYIATLKVSRGVSGNRVIY